MKKVVRKCIAVLLSLVILGTQMSFAESTLAEVSLTGGSIEQGETLVCAVNIKNNPHIYGADLKIVYDANNLRIKLMTGNYRQIDSTSRTSGIFSNLTANPSEGKAAWADSYGADYDDVLFWIVFETVENPINGNYSVSIEKASGENSMFKKSQGVEIPDSDFRIQSGTITVTGGIDREAVTPSVAVAPQSTTYRYGENAPTLTATAAVDHPADATLSYQWYSNTTDSDEVGTAIEGATEATYTPELSNFGTAYYYCVVTNTYNGQTFTATSDPAAVTYEKADFSSVTVTLAESSYTYDGTAKTPTVAVKQGETVLVAENYELSGIQSATDAGTYTITATGKGNYAGTASATWKIDPAKITVSGSKQMTIYTNGQENAINSNVLSAATVGSQTATITYAVAAGDDVVTLSDGKLTAKKVGTAKVTATITAPNHETATAEIQVEVKDKEQVELSGLTAKSDAPLTYTESFNKMLSDFVEEATGPAGGTGNITYTLNGTTATMDTAITNAGTYTVIATYEDDTQIGTKTVTFTIEKATIDVSGWTWNYTGPYTYNGTEQSVILNNSNTGMDKVNVTYTNNTATDAGNYTASATVTVKDEYAANYEISGAIPTKEWAIDRAVIEVPTAVTGLTYTGSEQTGVAASADGKYTVTNNAGINAGSYTATVTPTANYKWSDGTAAKEVTWSIGKAAAKTTLTAAVSLRYDNTEEQTYTADAIKALLDSNSETTVTVKSVSTVNDANVLNGNATIDNNVVKYVLASGLTAADKNKTATIAITVESNNYEDSTVTLTVTVIDKNDVSGSITFENGTAIYNGQAQTYEVASVPGGLTGTITYAYSPAEVKNAGTYTVAATYEDADNYGTKTATFTIKPAELTITGATVAEKAYDGTANAAVSDVTFSGLVNGEALTAADYTVGNAAFADANAGESKPVTFTVALKSDSTLAENYTLTNAAGTATGKITPKTVTVTLGDIVEQTYTGSAITPEVTVTAADTLNDYELVKDTDYTVVYENNTATGTAKATVKAKSGSNYTFADVSKEFAINKADPTVTAENLTVAYTGKELEDAAIEGTATFNGNPVEGTWTWVAKPTGTNVSEKAYTGKVKFTPSDASLNPVEQEISVTIEKANPTGEPKYTEVNDGNKTLADVKLEPGTLTPAGGTLTWVDDEGKELPDTTKVEANKAYTWQYVPADTANYNVITGTITPYPYIPYVPIPVPVGNPINATVPNGQNGTVWLSTASAVPGAVVTIAPAANVGYQVEYILVRDAMGNLIPVTGNADGTYSFVMPGSMVGVEVGFCEKMPAKTFADVAPGAWYADVVAKAVERGLFTGTSEDTFSPNGNMTRAMLWTVLARQSGVDTAGGNTWYEIGMIWAMNSGISDGTNPNANVTREQIVTMLWRYAGQPAARADALAMFSDTQDISDWAVDAMAWATENGILTGDNGRALPGNYATRAQVAAILIRFVERFAA